MLRRFCTSTSASLLLCFVTAAFAQVASSPRRYDPPPGDLPQPQRRVSSEPSKRSTTAKESPPPAQRLSLPHAQRRRPAHASDWRGLCRDLHQERRHRPPLCRSSHHSFFKPHRDHPQHPTSTGLWRRSRPAPRAPSQTKSSMTTWLTRSRCAPSFPVQASAATISSSPPSGRFGSVSNSHIGEWLDEVATRAASQNEQYLEIMETPHLLRRHEHRLAHRLAHHTG